MSSSLGGVRQEAAGEVGAWDASELGYELRPLANSLLPDEKESEDNEFGVFNHFVRDIEVHMSWCFYFEETSATCDLTMGFDHDGLRVGVYKLQEMSGFDSGEVSIDVRRVLIRFPWLSTCTEHY